MNNYQSPNNLGEQFKNAVSEALSSGDFKELNLLVTDTVTDAISEAGKQVKTASKEMQKEVFRDNAKIYRNTQQYQKQQNQRNQRFTQNTAVTPKKPSLPIGKTKNVGQISSILYMVFGGIGSAFSIFALLIGLICLLIGVVWSPAVFIVLALILILFLLMIRKGFAEKDRLKRMKRYISFCADKMYINIADLAEQAGKNTSYILKDVKKMLKLGFFPEGHLDEKESCLILDDATYREYLKIEKERKALAQEEASKRQKEMFKAEQLKNTNQELQIMISEGQEYIRKLHEMNDLIEGEVISQKLYRMENLLKEIFERVAEDPSQMPQMHKLMNYYLPTTIKLLQAYEEFDNISSPGEDVLAAKQQIEKTVDTINEAFVELLNKLFQSTVYDVTTDAQVLQTMLAKEGLTKNDFSEENR